MENQFGHLEILNEDLSPDDIPPASAILAEIFVFGLTYDGYEHHPEDCATIANRAAERYRDTGALPDSLDELHACLFFEQRRWHHFGCPLTEDATRYVRALAEAIRGLVSAAEV
jgi:hypothetical protein